MFNAIARTDVPQILPAFVVAAVMDLHRPAQPARLVATLTKEMRQLGAVVDPEHLAASGQVVHQVIAQGVSLAEHDLAQLSLRQRPLRGRRCDC